MILWHDGAHDPAENMRRDETLLHSFTQCAHQRDGAPRPPVLRLFGFWPHGITLGHAQSPERVLDLERCRADGVPWAVRPTGGRAVFHAEEWTYSLTAALDDPEWGGSLAAAYDRASRLIRDSLARLGVPAALAARHAAAPAEPASRGAAQSCFASTARHEVLLGRRKLVGSAQRRTPWGFLQHGSIRLADDSALYRDVLGAEPSLPCVDISATLARRAIVDAFERALGAPLEVSELSRDERRERDLRIAARARDPLLAPPFASSRFRPSADRLA